MPDPSEYLKAVLAAVVTCSLLMLAFRIPRWKRHTDISETFSILAMTCGLVMGYGVLKFSWTWPPSNGLDRFLTIVLPAACVLEFLAASVAGRRNAPTNSKDSPVHFEAGDVRHPGFFLRSLRTFVFVARLLLFSLAGRILLHDSVYLTAINHSSRDALLIEHMSGILVAGALGLIIMWLALTRISQRSESSSIAFSISLSILCAGCTTMMAGYIKGGSAALPLAAALVATALSARLVNGPTGSGMINFSGIIGIGLTGLFSLLWIGRFFGQLTTTSAIVIFLAPLQCWITEAPVIRRRTPMQKVVIRIVAVAIPLAIIMVQAKREFDEKMAPLLVDLTSATDVQEFGR